MMMASLAYIEMPPDHVECSLPEWCISTMIYSCDTPFRLETLDIMLEKHYSGLEPSILTFSIIPLLVTESSTTQRFTVPITMTRKKEKKKRRKIRKGLMLGSNDEESFAVQVKGRQASQIHNQT